MVIDPNNSTLITIEGNYEVWVGVSIMEPDNTGRVYMVYNTEYDVIEAETSCLPQALMTAQSYNNNVNEFFAVQASEGVEIPDGGSVN